MHNQSIKNLFNYLLFNKKNYIFAIIEKNTDTNEFKDKRETKSNV